MIIFAIIDVQPGEDGVAWAILCDRLAALDHPFIKPLVANKILEKGDFSVVLRTDRPSDLGRFFIDQVRSVKGIRDIESFNLYEGRFLESPEKVRRDAEGIQAFIFLATDPGKDREVYSKLCELPSDGETYPRFVGYTFHAHKCNILLSINAPDLKALAHYNMANIRILEGVEDTEILIGMEHRLLTDPEKIYGFTQEG